MDPLQIMVWAIGPAFMICFVLVILALSKGFEFFEEKKQYKMWPCTFISFGACALFLIGVFKPEFRTVLWIASAATEALVLLIDLIKTKLWGFLAFVIHVIVTVMFPVTLFIMISGFHVGEKHRN